MVSRCCLPHILVLLLLGLLTGCGAYMKLDGKVTRVRVVETGGPKTVLVVEFNITNTAKVGYVVKDAELTVTSDGSPVTGSPISVRDVQTLCQHMATLSGDCGQALLTREVIPAGETVSRLVAASFDLNAQQLRDREQLKVLEFPAK
jgi:hypothetical protein